jgi:uncharacterized protein (TIGR02284 family)
MDNQSQIDVLNDLIAKNYDAEYGFKEAAEDVDSPSLKASFLRYSNQRYQFGHELKAMVKRMGGEVEKGDTIASKLHRAWMDLKSAVASNEEKNILEEVQRGENNALNHYEEALKKLDGTSPAYSTVKQQCELIRESINSAAFKTAVYDNAE